MAAKFALICIVIVLATLTVIGLAPLFWDAAGAIESILNNVYHVEITVKGA